jgi:hypothetical protein
MEQEEIEILSRLKSQFKEGFIVKKTVLKARDIWNKYNTDKVNYCMCTKVRRNIYAKQFIEWYEDQNR